MVGKRDNAWRKKGKMSTRIACFRNVICVSYETNVSSVSSVSSERASGVWGSR